MRSEYQRPLEEELIKRYWVTFDVTLLNTKEPNTMGKYLDKYPDCCEPVGDVNEPLEIPRQKLIDTLQGNLDKERAEREERNAASVAAMNEVKAFLAEHQDETLGFVASAIGFSGWADVLRKLKESFDPDHPHGRDWKPEAIKPGSKETQLDHFVRVLGLAANEVVKVTPDQPLYHLL